MIACDHCGQDFAPSRYHLTRWKPGGGRFCSARCAKVAANERRRQQRAKEAPTPRPIECPCCRDGFTPTAHQWRMMLSGCLIYCPTCSQLTWKQRRSLVRRRGQAASIAVQMVEESSAFPMTPDRVRMLERLRRDAGSADRGSELPRWCSPLAWT